MFDWPHAPIHRFAGDGIYFVTAATYLKQHYYRRRDDLDDLMSLMFDLAKEHGLSLQAWSIFSNHYHLVAQGEGASLQVMLSQLHSVAARRRNTADNSPGRKVWFQFRDPQLTYERSWLARLRYTHQNPVKHGVVANAVDYPWCSAAWFERNASQAFVRSIGRFKTDTIRVPDEFDVVSVDRD
jgi:putative transposase